MLQFGTDGIRGDSNKFPFTDDALTILGESIAIWLKTKALGNKLFIGHDTRISCARIKQSLARGFGKHEINIIDGGVLPTAAVLAIINELQIGVGLVISASHNTYKDNGIKFFKMGDGKLAYEDEQFICDTFNALYTEQPDLWHSTIESIYINKVCSFFTPEFLKNKKIALDTANGATYKTAKSVFEKLGATVALINNKPNGKNINENCGSLHPQELQKYVVEQNAFVGFAFDGDGDRVIAVSANGQIWDGDDILAILMHNPTYAHTRAVVGTIMSNEGLSLHLKNLGKEFCRTKVGDKHVIAEMELRSKNGENVLVGGETSGHIILRDFLPTGDGIFAALRVTQTLVLKPEAKSFTKFPQVLRNISVKKRDDLSTEPYVTVIKLHENMLDTGRLIVRYSGTENLLRIMAESADEQTALLVVEKLSKELSTKLST